MSMEFNILIPGTHAKSVDTAHRHPIIAGQDGIFNIVDVRALIVDMGFSEITCKRNWDQKLIWSMVSPTFGNIHSNPRKNAIL